MKKIVSLISIAILTIALGACGSSSTPKNIDDNSSSTHDIENDKNTEDTLEIFTDDKKEIETYIIVAKKAYSELMILQERYEELRSVSEAKEMDDHEFGGFLHDEIIPTNSRITEDIVNSPTPNKQTIEINQLLIDAVSKQHLAFTNVIVAIESGDSPHIASVKKLLDEASKSEKEFVRRIEQLIIDINIE